MRLLSLAELSAELAALSKRTAKVSRIAESLRAAPAEERGLLALYLSGNVRQARLTVGGKQLAALRGTPGADAAQLSVADLDAALESVSRVNGKGSSERRAALLGGLFARATPKEQRFVTALILGELRQGALESLVIDAVAEATHLPRRSVRRAQMLVSDLCRITQLAFEEGESGLASLSLTLFRPIQPMLAEPAESLEAALIELKTAALDYKMDGARVQVHKLGDHVRVYSRALNEVSDAVPEVVAQVQSYAAESLVLDGEVIALREDGRPLPFQETMRRFGRRRDVPALSSELPLSTFFFDCMLANGRDLLDASLETRTLALRAHVPEAHQMPRIVTADVDEARAFCAQALASGHEGVMAKDLGSAYFAGSRGASWLKIKEAHTLDLVVLAAEWGTGRRQGYLSNLHLGARDPESARFVMLGKTFKGLTDELLRFQTQELLARETSRDRYVVYVRPELVVEVAFNDVQRSPQYPGGVALRFARVRRYRPDKLAKDADTLAQVKGYVRA